MIIAPPADKVMSCCFFISKTENRINYSLRFHESKLTWLFKTQRQSSICAKYKFSKMICRQRKAAGRFQWFINGEAYSQAGAGPGKHAGNRCSKTDRGTKDLVYEWVTDEGPEVQVWRWTAIEDDKTEQRAVTISDLHYMIIVGKRIHQNEYKIIINMMLSVRLIFNFVYCVSSLPFCFGKLITLKQ